MSPGYDELVSLRTAELRIPLGLEFTADQLEQESDQFHFGLHLPDWHLVGCLSFRHLEGQSLAMRQVAVSKDFQGRGIGRILVECAERWAKQHGFGRIELHARKTARPFYSKLEYHVAGDEYTELGIAHINMYKELV
ncbi:MAG: GNAT family N-acetyltransferase [Saprospiraceae bacterium]|nr:GNAT family N-acetyltransferase [Saprospiraceae bacterium]